MNNKLVVLAAGSIFIAALSFFQLCRSRRKKTKTPANTDRELLDPSSMEDRVLYMHEITDPQQYSLLTENPTNHPTITHLHYDLLLNLNKGTMYEGVVNISLNSQKKKLNSQNLYMNFVGRSVLYLAINGQRIDEEDVTYEKHQILIRKEWLQPHENHIEVIFSNKYAFMGDGLTSYFFLDENNKYSLKGQTIYSKNGIYQCPHIFPCFNVLNNCTLKLQIIQPEGFETFSNTPKSLVRLCSKQDFPQYPFFFQLQQRRLNRSFRIPSSSFVPSKWDGTSSHVSSDDLVKSITEFYEANLMTIHGFFVLCASVYEVRPTLHKNYSNEILIRYFTKQHCLKKAQSYVSLLHYKVMEINTRLEQFSSRNKLDVNISHKIDIFFIDDVTIEGNFYIGSIYLNEENLNKNFIDMRVFYLLCRAVVGMGLLDARQCGILTLEGKIKLNEHILDIFPQCTDYIYAKQFEYKKLKHQLEKKFKNSQQEEEFKRWFQQYYEKQCRLLVNNIYQNRVSSTVFAIMEDYDRKNTEQFWAHFVFSYQLLQPTVTEVILKIGTRDKGPPKDRQVLNYIKANCTRSKHYLQFFSDEQIQNDLKRFIQLDAYDLQKRIPFIKIKEKYRAFLNQKIDNYLCIKSNRLEARNLYDQFKRYNQGRNFHHLMILSKQIERVKLLAAQQIQPERKGLECGLLGWKLLRKLKISPKDDSLYELIESLQS